MPRIRILLWTRRSRGIVLSKLENLFPENYREHMKSISSIIDELAKNAIKANHKHLIIRKRILDYLRGNSREKAQEMLKKVCGTTDDYNAFIKENPSLLEGITEELSAILRQESVWIDLRNKQKNTKDDLGPEDREKLERTKKFTDIYAQVKGRRTYVEVRGSRNMNMVWIELINNAPILRRDLARIEEKRTQFKKHREAGTEYEFFLNAMDNSDGGSGLGYATIDSHLSDMGLDPLAALKIISLHSTNAMLNIDLDQLSSGKA